MADLPEFSIFSDGVYQLETTDPVLGGANGVSNSQAKTLANRTRWLKDNKADLESPALTGTPTAPTPSTSDNSTRLATTAWVRSALATLATAAGYSMSATQNGYIKLPSFLGGLVIQWGLHQIDNQSYVDFPLVFPHQCFSVVMIDADVQPTQPIGITALSTSRFNFTGDGNYWIAIGH